LLFKVWGPEKKKRITGEGRKYWLDRKTEQGVLDVLSRKEKKKQTVAFSSPPGRGEEKEFV